MTTINTATPSKAMEPVLSCVARISRVTTVAFAAKKNRSSLPVTLPRAPTSPPPTGVSSLEPVSNNQKSVLNPIANNPKLPYSVANYSANNNQFMNNLMDLKEIVKTGATFTSSTDSLAASQVSLVKVEVIIVLLYPIQLSMKQNEQSYGDTLDAKLHNIASLVFLAVGKRMDTHQDELKIPVKKCKDISEAITGATKLALGHLEEIMTLVSDLKSHTQNIPAMVGPQVAMESNAIVNKLAALKLGFQILEVKVDCCITDANSARQGVIHTVMNNLD